MRQAYETEMKVFTCDGEEWVVAANPEDAAKAYTEETGCVSPTDTGYDDGAPIPWTECNPDREFTLHDDDGPDVKMTYAEFAVTRGRGYLGSANY